MELDMDPCVRSARRICAAEVTEFNASPFDNSLFEKMNECIERNAAAIEADCIVSVQQEVGFFSFFDEGHPPCRHPDDVLSNLPVCSQRHRCFRGRKLHIIAGIFGFVVAFFAMIFLSRRLFSKYSKAKAAKQVSNENTEAATPEYHPLVESKV